MTITADIKPEVHAELARQAAARDGPGALYRTLLSPDRLASVDEVV
jgi:hypothetical protein